VEGDFEQLLLLVVAGGFQLRRVQHAVFEPWHSILLV
jgi:hypothetical protein